MPRIRLALVVVFALIGASACRETGDVQVSSIKFTGMQAVSAGDLKAVIATQESGFLPWSRRRFFDRQAFDEDVKRLQAFYTDRGYPDAKVLGVDVQFNDAKDKVAITVQISEGEPVLVSNVSFEGLDVIPADHLETLQARLPIKSGSPRDQRLILASHDMVVGELRDHGFPYGSVRMLERPEAEPRRVQLAVAADPGPKSVFGAIAIEGVASVDEEVIRRELGFAEGDLYQLSRIAETQRRLYGLELFQFVNVSPKLPEDRSPRVPVVVTVLEGKHRRLQLAAGYGSEEKGRARINWRHVNFGGGARTGETEGKVLIARTGPPSVVHRAIHVSARPVDADNWLDLVGGRADLRIQKLGRTYRHSERLQPRGFRRRARRPKPAEHVADSRVRRLYRFQRKRWPIRSFARS